MAKGAPRNAAEAILQSADSSTASSLDLPGVEVEYQPAKKGVKAGLRPGETRITCIYRDDQSQVLHDWAKTTGRTFREVCLAMADRYIEEVIRPATSGKKKLKRTSEPPEAYIDLYETEASADEWAQFF